MIVKPHFRINLGLRNSFCAAFCFLILLVLSMPAVARQLTQTGPVGPEALGSISGTVTNESNEPLAGIDVNVSEGRYYYYADDRSVRTDTNGQYQVNGLLTSIYTVAFSDPAGQYRTMYSGNVTDQNDAARIPVTGNSVTGIDAVLPLGTGLSGSVTVTSDFIDGSFDVTVYSKMDSEFYGNYWTYVASLHQNISESEYRFNSLDPGTYRVCANVSGQISEDPFEYRSFNECYDDVVTGVENAEDIELTETGTILAGIDFVLGQSEQYGSISGAVKDAQGNPMADVKVVANAYPAPYYYPMETTTDENGLYILDSVLPTTVTVSFQPTDGVHVAEYYDNVRDFVDAAELQVGSGNALTGIDAQLEIGGSISGKLLLQGNKVTQDVRLSLYPQKSDPFGFGGPYYWGYRTTYDNVYDVETGIYQIEGISPGIYLVEVELRNDISSFYGGPFFEDATPVNVALQSSTENIDISIAEGKFEGAIEGRVTSNGGALAGIHVQILNGSYYYDPSEFYYSESALISYAVSDEQGSYSIGGLTNNEYIIRFASPDGMYVPLVYEGDGAIPHLIAVTDGIAMTGVNGDLVEAARISGTIVRPDGTPASYYAVAVERKVGDQVETVRWGAYTDHNGYYEITELAPGTYTVRFMEPPFYGTTNLRLEVEVQAGDVLFGQNGLALPGMPTNLPAIEEPAQEEPTLTEALFLPFMSQ